MVARITCRSLQWFDYPRQLDGLKRCHHFFTSTCLNAVTARQHGGQNNVEKFIEYGLLSPALQPFMGAYRVDLGHGTYTPAHPPLRGAIVSFPVQIQAAPILSLQ